MIHSKARHVGIIIDGNRRYSKKYRVPLKEAYALGAKRLSETVKFILGETDIPELTIYAFSSENLSRSGDELGGMLSAGKSEVKSWIEDPFFRREGIRVNFIGNMDSIRNNALKEICLIFEKVTRAHGTRTLNVLVAYNPYEELYRVSHKIAQIGSDKPDTANRILKNMRIKDSVDVVIRAGGDYRLSGFLPLHTANAELFFLDKFWPEVTIQDIRAVLSKFEARERIYGL